MERKEGIALILGMFTMLFVSLLVVVFLDMVTIEQKISTNQIRTLQATYIADAGVEEAVYQLRQDDEWSGTGGDVEFPSGSGNSFNVSLDDNTIISTGTVGNFTVGNFTKVLNVDFTLSGSFPPYRVLIDKWQEQWES